MEVEIKKVKLSEIKLNPDNPRQISKEGMERLVKSLQDFPEMMKVREIVVDEDMMILGGNMRFRVLQQIKEKDSIIKIVKGLTPEQKRRFVISDNGEWGEWDFDMLANAWGEFPLAEWGVGLPAAWSNEQLDQSEDPDSDEPEKPTIVICPKCNHAFSVLKEKK